MPHKKRGLPYGSVEFSGFGGFPEKMASELLRQGVQLRRVRFGDGTISGAVSPMDYWLTAKTAQKCGVRIRSGKRRGLYFSVMRYSRRAGLYVGFLTFLTIISMGSSHIQDIVVEGSGGITPSQRSRVMTILEECGIKRGVPARGLNIATAERRMMLEIPEAAWTDVSCVGFRVKATLELATPKPDMPELDAPCNLVASRGAKVIGHTVRDGTLVAETGSGVPAGGLLVSGVVTDSAGNVTLKHASADIIGEFTESREFFVPYNETVSTADGGQTEFRWILAGGDEIPLFWGEAAVPDSVYHEETEVLSLFGHEIPLKLRRGVFTKLRQHDVTRSADDCLAELERLQSDFEQNFYGEYEIYSCDETAVPEQDGIRLTAVYTLRGNIAEERVIETG